LRFFFFTSSCCDVFFISNKKYELKIGTIGLSQPLYKTKKKKEKKENMLANTPTNKTKDKGSHSITN